MRAVLVTAFLFSFGAFVSAQTAAQIDLRAAGAGKIAVAKGKMRAVVDLTGETAGCVYAAGREKRALERRGCTASAASYELIDAVEKNGRYYLVVLSEAAGNCNVCGRCGATESFALVWLALDARLRVIEKKSVPIEYCLGSTSLVRPVPGIEEYENDAELKLSFEGDLLRVAYEKAEITSDEPISYQFSTLRYDRKTPEKGFVIETEKRAKSALDEQ